MAIARLNQKINRIEIINNIQNPQEHMVPDYLKSERNIRFKTTQHWIEFENNYSIENFCGLNGNALFQMVNLLCVMNLQAGIATRHMEHLKAIPRKKILSLYYRYESVRKKTVKKEVYKNVSAWLYANHFISELELARLVSYGDITKIPNTLDDFNTVLMNREIPNYVEAYWI